ncbi:LPXTG cell wall anchor domain-containing protein [Nocardioides jishulii]|uniref:LPXTG cell wall anchor domain-containing protein n=2 Tax=Nocardioides jishulii TaxID=2575440 RepID=A0A4U2YNI5_9ACTN|nr:LPXTG cell wall anchor domain-containing protein [Nocardioides jishulii]TKI62414.1 LPXTG cell wall anchor domain-containing protein [Nocardioides jishulii]
MKGTFTKAYDYKVKVTVAGARAEEGSSKVTIAADFGDIPGLAPVPISNGNMRVTSKLSLDGTEVEVKGSSSVNAAANQPVPVPRLTGTGTVEGDSAKVEVKTFNFEFDKISGADVAADCTSDNGTVGTMTMGVGDIDDLEPPSRGGNGGTGGGTTTLPQTGGGDAMPVIGLWALALGVIGAGLLVWMPRQRRSTI